MAKKVAAMGGLAGKLGAAGQKAFLENKDADVVIPGGGDIPAGIELGIAKLNDCRFGMHEPDKQNAGEYYFYASAIVVEPKKLGKIPVEGLRTWIQEPMYATPKKSRKTVDEHVKWAMNMLKLLGADMSGIEFGQLEDVAAAIKELGPYIKFRTSKLPQSTDPQFKDSEPMTYQQWFGAVEYEEEETTGVEEDTSAVPDPAPTTKAADKKPPVKGATAKTEPVKAATTTKAPVKGKKVEPEIPFGDDLDMTADKADAGENEEAMVYLQTEALKIGKTQEEIDNSENWAEVAGWIRDALNGETEESEVDYDALGTAADGGDADAAEKLTALGLEFDPPIDVNEHVEKTWAEFAGLLAETAGAGDAEAPFEPKVEEVYKTVVAKGKPAVEAQITAVFAEKRTVNVKSLDDGKPYKGISWDNLSSD